MNTTTLEQEYIDVTSVLYPHNNMYYITLSWYIRNKRHQKQKSLKLKATAGNRALAKQKQKEETRIWEKEVNQLNETVERKGSNVLFGEYMKTWLKNIKPSVETTTYASYKCKVKVIAEYFNNANITLAKLKRSDIKLFYQHLINTKGIKPQTLRRYHANIHKALNEAVELELISINPADKITLDKSEQYIADYYNCEELNTLFRIASGNLIELHILLASYYRSKT